MCCPCSRSLQVVLACLLALVSVPGISVADPPRIKTFVASGDRLLEDLQFLTVDLAHENKQWTDNIYPSIDIFLVGLDTRQPIRFDIMLGGNAAQGWRYQASIPVANLKTFIDKNLEPIGIDAKRKDRRGTYYELTGGVYDGGMRIVDEKKSMYACLAALGFEKTDIPEGMDHPSLSHQTLLDRGYDIAAELVNVPELMDQRDQDFVVFQEKNLAQIKKRPDETKESYALRQITARHQLEVLHRAYVEAEQATLGWTTDVEEQNGRGDLYVSAFPETSLAEYLNTLAAEPSSFAALPAVEDAVVGLRVNLAIDGLRQQQEREWYEVARPVVSAKIDAIEDRSENEKAALQKIATQVFDMLVAGIELGRLDLVADVIPQSSGQHTLLIAVRAKDGKAADAIVDLIPQAHEGWTVEKDIESVEGVAIHKVDVSKDNIQALIDFFGASGTVYVGTSADSVWVAAGDKSLEILKSSIESVAQTDAPVATEGKIIDLKLRALPLLTLIDDYVRETGHDLLESLNLKGQVGAGETLRDETEENVGPIGAGGIKPIEPAELRSIAIKALQDIDDRISLDLRKVDDHVEGQILLAPGPLRTIGKVIAKVAADNL